MEIREVLNLLARGETLSAEQTGDIFKTLMAGELTASQIGALLGMMGTRPPDAEELAGAARVMRDVCVKIPHEIDVLVDTCGTGGDHSGTFNISTCVAFVVAAAGAPVAKHGNRSATSRCGGADLLEVMGWDLDAEPGKLEACLKETGFTFLFARKMHPAMRHVAPVRSELGIRTIFNFLGPMSNPAGASHQLVGISDPSMRRVYAEALGCLGSKVAMVVCSRDGLDEISLASDTDVVEWRDGSVKAYTISPRDAGLELCEKEALIGGTVEENQRITQEILRDGATGPKRDVVVLNAAAALCVAGKAPDIRAGAVEAAEAISSGAAWAKVEEVMAYIKD